MLDRHVQLVAVGVLELHVLALLSVFTHQPHARKAPDAVIDMNDQVARLKLKVPAGRARPDDAAPDSLSQSTKEVGVAVDLQLLRRYAEALRYRLIAEDDQPGGQWRL